MAVTPSASLSGRDRRAVVADIIESFQQYLTQDGTVDIDVVARPRAR
jgi:hypothetical protein